MNENVKNEIEMAIINNSENINLDVLKEINKLYKMINKKIFKDELDNKVFITIYNDLDTKKRQIEASLSGKIWNSNFNQLTLKSVIFDGNIKNIISAMWHEMIHKLANQRNIKDVEKNGRHNKKFKELALSFGLKVTDPISKNVGYGTDLELKEYEKLDLSKINVNLLENFKETYFPVKKETLKKETYKYFCPNDLYKFTLSKKLSIKCNDCGKDFQLI